MPLDFPANPSSGDQTTLNNVTYEFDGSKWTTLSSLFSRGTFSAGNAPSPGFSVSGDLDTGFYSPGANSLGFSTGGTGRAVVDSSGRFLLGTSSALSVDGNAGFQKFQVAGLGASISRFENSGAPPVLSLSKSRSDTVGTNAVLQIGDSIGILDFRAADGSSFIRAAQIRAQVDGTPGNNDMPGRLTFSTTADGASSATERMRIDSSGKVGIGTTNINTNARLEASGRIMSSGDYNPAGTGISMGNNVTGGAYGWIQTFAGNPMALNPLGNNVGIGTDSPAQALHVVGEIIATDDITAFYSSDRRLKQDIEPIEDAVEKVKQISGVTYAWNDEYLKDKYVDGYFVRDREAGVIAQEIEEVLPEIVATRENGYKAVKYDRLVALLIEAVKEQQEQIDELKAKLEE